MSVKVAFCHRSDAGVTRSKVVQGGRFKISTGGGGVNFRPESDEQTGNQGRGRGVRVQGNRQRQGRAKQRNETYLTYILAHFTRTVVIKAQGASTSYFFLQ